MTCQNGQVFFCSHIYLLRSALGSGDAWPGSSDKETMGVSKEEIYARNEHLPEWGHQKLDKDSGLEILKGLKTCGICILVKVGFSEISEKPSPFPILFGHLPSTFPKVSILNWSM